MKLAVIGTSNSILRGGYADALREDPQVEKFLRIGPGGSTSVILPYFGRDLDFADYDAVIIDTSINDSAFLGWGLIQRDEIRDNLTWALHQAIAAQCHPVILCLPNRTCLGNGDGAFDVYRQIAQDFGVPLFDGYAYATEHAAAAGLPIAELFVDDLHLRAEVARQIAPRLLDLCRQNTGPVAIGSQITFRKLDAAQIDLPQHYRSTSLLGADCAVVLPADSVRIALAAGESIVGVAYNAGMTFGSLIFAGDNTVAINVRSHYYEKNEFVAAARQVSPAARSRDGFVDMRLQNVSSPRAEIMGLLIRSA